MNFSPQVLGLISMAQTRALSSFAALGDGKSLISVLHSLADLAEADKHVVDAAIWFMTHLAGAEDKVVSFLPLAEAASARMARKMAVATLKNSTPVRKR